jgi:hypothetical protein
MLRLVATSPAVTTEALVATVEALRAVARPCSDNVLGERHLLRLARLTVLGSKRTPA